MVNCRYADGFAVGAARPWRGLHDDERFAFNVLQRALGLARHTYPRYHRCGRSGTSLNPRVAGQQARDSSLGEHVCCTSTTQNGISSGSSATSDPPAAEISLTSLISPMGSRLPPRVSTMHLARS